MLINLPKTIKLQQLAEESSELAQAALKYSRALEGINPTPRTPQECYDALIEEAADVILCLEECGIDLNIESLTGERIDLIKAKKKARWVQRLKEKI